MSVETTTCQPPVPIDLPAPPYAWQAGVDLTGIAIVEELVEVKEPVDLSLDKALPLVVDRKAYPVDKDLYQTEEKSCLTCPRFNRNDRRRNKSRWYREAHFWRDLVEKKNIGIRQLEKELGELKEALYIERISYRKQIKELLKERDELRVKFEQLEKERDKLSEQVAIYFDKVEKVIPKKSKVKEKKEKKRPGAKDGHRGWFRTKPEEIDEVIEETLTQCPDCGSLDLTECKDVTEATVEDIVPIRRKVTLYRQHYYWCPSCRKKVTKKSDRIKRGRLGKNTISYTAELRHEFKLPYWLIAKMLKRLCNLEVTPGGLSQAMKRSAKEVEGISGAIIESIKKSSCINGDETYWNILSMDKRYWWLWCFCNSQAVYYDVDEHRSSEVVRKILGERIDGVLITDFYSSYNKIEAKKQRCLVHLLRDIKNYLEEDGCDSLILTRLKEEIEEIIEEGLKLQKDAGTGTALGLAWQLNRQLLKERLEGLCILQSEDANARRLIKRLNRFKGEILTFISYPEVEYHNNRAERMLRPLVVSRKISYGSQTEESARATCIMMSILMTCQIRGIDFGEFIRDAVTERVKQSVLIRRLLGISPPAERAPP